MNRRRFAFWLGFGIFSLGEKLRASSLDRIAAAVTGAIQPSSAAATTESAVHWRAASNRTWQWFERETFADGRWTVTGITTPINKHTGDRYTGATGYLEDSLVPTDMKLGHPEASLVSDPEDPDAGTTPRRPHASRRARHGRPPSRWLRNLHANELRIWLKTIDVPESGVEGMTYWEHLTRDHFFDAHRIAGLSISEQAKLHAAAHYGY